ncbi:MAG: hypothetical protein R6V58_01375, partial [Planctomycetota bacterium]
MARLLLTAVLAALGSPAWAADGPSFAEPPTAVKRGKTVAIGFAAHRPTDVAVTVVDAEGEVVRHLAAGKIGGGAKPPAPLKPGLRQELVWDGTNDDGKPAGGGPFKVRVGLGLTAGLDRVIGWSGQRLGGVSGFAVGPDGTFYLIAADSLYAHRITWVIGAFSREGKYLRQVFPGPANLPPENRAGWPRFKRADGVEVPVVYHLLSRSV